MWLAAAAAFNLVCSGTMSFQSLGHNTSEPYQIVFRINLDAKKYCNGDCRGLIDIAEVEPTRLVLQTRNVDGYTEKEFLDETIDRQTGRHSRLHTSGQGGRATISKWEGQCEQAAFTGFPEFKTKF